MALYFLICTSYIFEYHKTSGILWSQLGAVQIQLTPLSFSALSPMPLLYQLAICNSDPIFVKLFATVPYSQHYYDTGFLDEECLGMDRVADY